MLNSQVYDNGKIVDDDQIYLRWGPFWWPCRFAGAMWCTVPDAACSGLLRNPLDATIRQLPSLYCPGGHLGNSKQKNDEKMHKLCWPCWWPWQCARYVTACIGWWMRSRASLEATGHRHGASIMSNNIKGTYLCRFNWCFSLLTR